MGDAHVFRDTACWFHIANAGLSLLENLTVVGSPLCQIFCSVLLHFGEYTKLLTLPFRETRAILKDDTGLIVTILTLLDFAQKWSACLVAH